MGHTNVIKKAYDVQNVYARPPQRTERSTRRKDASSNSWQTKVWAMVLDALENAKKSTINVRANRQ